MDDEVPYEDKNKNQQTEVTKLIDEWISCSKITDDKTVNKIVREVNTHKCMKKSCFKNRTTCRFDFPRPPSVKTMIARPIHELYPEYSPEEQTEIVQKAQEAMKAVKEALVKLDNNCFDYDHTEESHENLKKFLTDCVEFEPKLSVEKYQQYLQISVSGRSVILKRVVSDRNVNNYNPTFIKAWNANSDFQICLDSFAVVTYVTDYLTKADKGLTALLSSALREKRGAEKFELCNHLKKTYFTHTQTCVCMAAYRLIPGLELKGSTVKCLFLQSGFKDKRKMYLHPVKVGDEEGEDADEDDIEKWQATSAPGEKYVSYICNINFFYSLIIKKVIDK